MDRKIVVFGGSPRKNGCTAFLVNQICSALNAEKIMLREKDIQLCAGCMVCLDNKTDCVIKDDSQEIISKIKASDLLVFVVPNYIHNVPGLFKNFIDRLLPVYGQQLKKSVFVYLGAGGEAGTEQDVYDAVATATKGMKMYLGFGVAREFAFMCTNEPDIAKQQEKIDSMISEIKSLL